MNQCKALLERMINAEANLLQRMDKLEKQVFRAMHNPNLSTWWHEPVVKVLNALLILHKNPTDAQCKEGIGNALHVEDYGYTLDAFYECIHAYVDKHCRDKRGRWSSDARKAFQKNNDLAKNTPLARRQQVLVENYATQVRLQKFGKDCVYHRNPSDSDMEYLKLVLSNYSKGKRMNDTNEDEDEAADEGLAINWNALNE